MILRTVSEELKVPMEALESTATMIPPLYLNARVVVPFLKSISCFSFPAALFRSTPKPIESSPGANSNLKLEWSKLEVAALSS